MRSNRAVKLTFKICAVVFALLFALMCTADVITSENATQISAYLGEKTFHTESVGDDATDTDYFKTNYSSVAELRADGEKLVKEVEEGGAVLLKNENDCLPLNVDVGEKNVSVFSLSSVDPAYVAKGSSAGTNPKPAIDLKSGFEGAGLSVNPTLYDFYSANKTNSNYAPNGNMINDVCWSDVVSADGVESSFTSR